MDAIVCATWQLRRGCRGVGTFALVAALCVLVSVVSDDARAQAPSEAFGNWAKTRAVALRTVELDDDVTDLLPLVSLVGSAHVVALGEPGHGMHEPLAFRNRLIRFLVERMGFTAIALETGFTESHLIARYVAGGPGDLHSVVSEGMTWGFGSLLENEELVRWVREHNAKTTTRRQVRFYGIDLTGGTHGAFAEARRAVDFSLTVLSRVDSAAWLKLGKSLDPILARFSTAKYAQLSTSERELLASRLAEVTAALKRNRSAIVQTRPEGEYAWALHSIVVARQLNAHFEVSPPYRPSDATIPPDAYRSMTARDSAMAENVGWALEREGPGGRLVVFAHDSHVMNSAVEGGVWSALRQPPAMMGTFLRTKIGPDLVIIGTVGHGTRGELPRMEAAPTSIETSLAAVPSPCFILDIRRARNDPSVSAWVSQPQTLHVNLNSYIRVKPSEAFDAILFLESLTAAHVPGAAAPGQALAPER